MPTKNIKNKPNSQISYRTAGLVGAIGNGDLGDVAMLISAVDELKKSRLFNKIIVFSSNEAETRHYLKPYGGSYVNVVPFIHLTSLASLICPKPGIMRRALERFSPRLHRPDEGIPSNDINRSRPGCKERLKMWCVSLGARVIGGIGTLRLVSYAKNFKAESAAESTASHPEVSRFLANLKDVDILISIGGGYLNSNSPGFLYSLVATYVIAQRYGVDTILVGQTIGPLSKLDRLVLKKAISQARLISVRDEAFSRNELTKTGVNSDSVIEACDEATFLRTDEDKADKLLSDSGLSKSQPYIILQLHDWGKRGIGGGKRGIDEILREVAAFCDLIVEEYNCEIVYTPMQTAPSRDAELGGKVSRYMKQPDRMHLIKPGVNPTILKSIVAGARVAVHTRLHPLVFAIGENTPTLTICCDKHYYQRKLFGLMALFDIDIPGHTLFLEEVTSDSLYAAFQRIITNASWVSEKSLRENRGIHDKFWADIFKIAAEETSKAS
jgi:polysaccharide pyruvyl transferase WcaK-like protein